MRFKLWLEELTAGQKQQMVDWGYDLVDSVVSGEYQMYLLRGDMYQDGFKYHIAVQRTDTNVFDIDQQMDVDRDQRKKIPLTDQFTAMKPMISKLRGWCDKYGKLIIASRNPRRTQKWINSLMYVGREYGVEFEIEQGDYMGHKYHAIK